MPLAHITFYMLSHQKSLIIAQYFTSSKFAATSYRKDVSGFLTILLQQEMILRLYLFMDSSSCHPMMVFRGTRPSHLFYFLSCYLSTHNQINILNIFSKKYWLKPSMCRKIEINKGNLRIQQFILSVFFSMALNQLSGLPLRYWKMLQHLMYK